MAQQMQPLPPWLKRAVKCGVITEQKAYLMQWYVQIEEWTLLPETLQAEAGRIYLLDLPVGMTQ